MSKKLMKHSPNVRTLDILCLETIEKHKHTYTEEIFLGIERNIKKLDDKTKKKVELKRRMLSWPLGFL